MDPERLRRLRDGAASSGLDGLLCWRVEDVVMASGYLPHWGLSVAYIPIAGEAILFQPANEPEGEGPAGFIERRYPWGDIGTGEPWRHLERMLASEIGSKRVGCAMSGAGGALPANFAELPPFPEGLMERYASNDAEFLVTQLRSRKTGLEVERLRLANQVARAGISAFYDKLIPGVTEAAVAAEVEAEIQRQIDGGRVRTARAWAFVQSGENTCVTGTFNRSSARPLSQGDIITVELATCVNGYWSDLTRTGFVGEPSEAQAALLATVERAKQAAMATVRAGATAAQVDAAARTVIEDAGLRGGHPHPTGHAVGFRYHDAGPVLLPGNESILEPGMVLTIEPGIYGAAFGGGCRVEENVLVGEQACSCLSC